MRAKEQMRNFKTRKGPVTPGGMASALSNKKNQQSETKTKKQTRRYQEIPVGRRYLYWGEIPVLGVHVPGRGKNMMSGDKGPVLRLVDRKTRQHGKEREGKKGVKKMKKIHHQRR